MVPRAPGSPTGVIDGSKDLAATAINNGLSGKSFDGVESFVFVVSATGGSGARAPAMQALAKKYGWDKAVVKYGADGAGGERREDRSEVVHRRAPCRSRSASPPLRRRLP